MIGIISSAILHFLMIVLFVGGIIISISGVFSCVLTADTSQGVWGLVIGVVLMSFAYAIRHRLGSRIRF